MATFHEALLAIAAKKRISHEGWYDGQYLLWDNQEQYLMLSPKLLLSEDWKIESEENSGKKKAKKNP